MGRTAVAKEGFGSRILRLAGDRSLVDIAKAAGLRYGLLWRWTQRREPPRGMGDRISRLEAVLGASLTEEPGEKGVGVVKINESRLPYGPEPERYVQPLDFKKRALDEVGRSRHELAAAIALIQDGPFDPRQLAGYLEAADYHAALAQRHLMGKIRINDRGEKI